MESPAKPYACIPEDGQSGGTHCPPPWVRISLFSPWLPGATCSAQAESNTCAPSACNLHPFGEGRGARAEILLERKKVKKKFNTTPEN